jgi:hypothetical protein
MGNDATVLIGYHDKVCFEEICQIIQVLNYLFHYLTLLFIDRISLTKKETVKMIRMNPQQVHNKSVKRNLFPKQEEYFSKLFTEEGFRMFLETNATTREGMLLVASRYGVEKVWEHWLSGTD